MDHKRGGFLTLAMKVKHLEELRSTCRIGANGDMEHSQLAKINPKVCSGKWKSVSHEFCKSTKILPMLGHSVYLGLVNFHIQVKATFPMLPAFHFTCP